MKIINGFPNHLKRQAATIYFAAFEGKIGGILGRNGKGVDFITSVIDPGHAISAVNFDETELLGLAGFKTREGMLVGGELSDLATTYGWFGALWRAVPLSLLERDLEAEVLLMDGIAVTENARGMGIGTKLLNAVFDEAKKRSKKEIRLDVIDTNPKAKALYERMGFVDQGSEELGPFKYLFGFSSAIKMKRTV